MNAKENIIIPLIIFHNIQLLDFISKRRLGLKWWPITLYSYCWSEYNTTLFPKQCSKRNTFCRWSMRSILLRLTQCCILLFLSRRVVVSSACALFASSGRPLETKVSLQGPRTESRSVQSRADWPLAAKGRVPRINRRLIQSDSDWRNIDSPDK